MTRAREAVAIINSATPKLIKAYVSVDDMMQLAKGDSLAFAPGTGWPYGNTGMLVLGRHQPS